MKVPPRAFALTCLLLLSAAECIGQTSVLDQRPQPWMRKAEPVLSARTTKEDWCRIVCYSPHVLYHNGRFRMWYLGTSEASRSNDMRMGYAESDDGIHWKPHPGNPVLTGDDVPWGRIIQTPFVIYDHAAGQFRMWFVSGDGVTRDDARKIVGNDQQLAYATSPDGIRWQVHPRPLYACGRSPCVVRKAANQYRMWMGSRPDHKLIDGGLYRNIYEFRSTDGLAWTRGLQPVVQPDGPARSTVYPFVLKEDSAWYMWYGCHVEGRKFEIFCAKSADGTDWKVNHDQPAFPAAEGRTRFDSRYTSTPCVVRQKNRLLLYYSARDWQTEYVDGQGRRRRDGAGIYAHIGVAQLMLEPKADKKPASRDD